MPPEWQRDDISHRLLSNGGWGGSLADTKQSWHGEPRQRRNDPWMIESSANRVEVALLKGTKEPLAQWLWVSFRSATLRHQKFRS
jgi:hypothetical protein